MSGIYNLLDQLDLGITAEEKRQAKQEMLRTPFLKIAKKYGFKPEALEKAIEYLSNRSVTAPLKPSEDYHYIKKPKRTEIYCYRWFSETTTFKSCNVGHSR